MPQKDEAKLMITFHFKKATKGTYVYEERADIPHVGTIYVKKYTFGAEPPKDIRVAIVW